MAAKIPETLITLHLEQQLTKEQIFEDYANAIYLGIRAASASMVSARPLRFIWEKISRR